MTPINPNRISLLLFLCLAAMPAKAAPSDLPARLGYDVDAKLLIIHADDFGMCHSENQATIDGLENGVISSASLMMPCPWIPEAVAYATANPNIDVGIHLTLTSEWNDYKWGPLLGPNVPSLVTDQGYFHDSVSAFNQAADLNEVEHELRAQIERAQEMGINITHVDAHMRAAVSTPELLRLYIQLGRELRVPVMLDGPGFFEHYGVQKKDFVSDQDVLIDGILDARPAHFDSGMREYYTKLLSDLQPGLYVLLVHVGFDNSEMQAITEGHDYWHADWRQIDHEFVTDPATRQLLEDNGIQLVTWREVRDKLLR